MLYYSINGRPLPVFLRNREKNGEILRPSAFPRAARGRADLVARIAEAQKNAGGPPPLVGVVRKKTGRAPEDEGVDGVGEGIRIEGFRGVPGELPGESAFEEDGENAAPSVTLRGKEGFGTARGGGGILGHLPFEGLHR